MYDLRAFVWMQIKAILDLVFFNLVSHSSQLEICKPYIDPLLRRCYFPLFRGLFIHCIPLKRKTFNVTGFFILITLILIAGRIYIWVSWTNCWEWCIINHIVLGIIVICHIFNKETLMLFGCGGYWRTARHDRDKSRELYRDSRIYQH